MADSGEKENSTSHLQTARIAFEELLLAQEVVFTVCLSL